MDVIAQVQGGSQPMIPLTTALVGLTVVIIVQIAVIARWTGRIETKMEGNKDTLEEIKKEVTRLRDARHDTEGKLQRLEGTVREHGRILYHRRSSDHLPHVDSNGG